MTKSQALFFVFAIKIMSEYSERWNLYKHIQTKDCVAASSFRSQTGFMDADSIIVSVDNYNHTNLNITASY